MKEQSREHNAAVAAELGIDADFVVGTIGGVALDRRPRWCSRCTPATPRPTRRWPGRSSGRRQLVLAAPCCHHDISAQLRKAPTPAPYAMLTRHGILRERLADTLTDGLRASLMRLQGYRVDVVQFVESQHTPRNTMLRAVRTGAPVKGGSARKEYDEMVDDLGSAPKLARAARLMLDRIVGLVVAGPVRDRLGRRRRRACRRRSTSPSRTRRSSSPAAWSSATGCS